ncbi:MAG: class I SAM-dependent methyltransferase [Promethearchaeota archaeon]
MEKIHPTLKKYDKQATSYDTMNVMMENLFSKGRPIFNLLRGKILEVGVGTGENLRYYHSSAKLTVFDWSPQMIQQAEKKMKRLKLKNVKNFVVGDIQRLSNYFKPNSFDFVTSTCVFCSVPDPIKGLKEITKVLNPSGKLVQIEHGISNLRLLNLFMRVFDPITANTRGFHLTRNILRNLKMAGFEVIHEWSLDPAGIVKVIISKPKFFKTRVNSE